MKGLFRSITSTGIIAALLVSGCGSSPKTEAPAYQEKPLDTVIQEASENIEARVAQKTKIALLNFNSPTGQFSEYVLDELSANLVNSGKLIVVDRREIDLIRNETAFQLSGEVSDESAQQIGKILGAQSIVTGSLVTIGDSYRITIKVIIVESAAIVVQFRSDIVNDNRVKALLANGKNGGTQTTQTGGTGGGTAAATTPPVTAAPVNKADAAGAAANTQASSPAAIRSASAADTRLPMITAVERRRHFVLYNDFDSMGTKQKDETFNPFLISESVVPFELWFDVFEWAVTQGYVFTRNGREGKSGEVYGIDVQNAFVWCNALSEYSGIAPYYADAQGVVLKNAGFHGNLTSSIAAGTGFWDKIKKLNNSGYRLPSYWEAELVHTNLKLLDMNKLLIEPWTSGYSLTNAYNIGWQRLDSSNGFRVVRGN
ncbi:hypothetical protein FACS1894142_6290 [Spirochaetia bacterium]|nr:hypothetical protein FACS1894142_6290 [Spirochaetia bacterium]